MGKKRIAGVNRRSCQKSTLLGEIDVLIIGGGPSGTSTALHLERLDARLAKRTLVLEKSHHPREKICGGALTLNAERMLSELGISADIRSAPVHCVRLLYGDAHIDLPKNGCAKRVIRRCELDSLLFQTVKDRGIRTAEDICVSRVVRFPDHLQVMTNRGHYNAKVVVSADGVNAVLRKAPGFGPGKMTRVYEIETPADPAREQVFTDQLLLVDMTYVRAGLKGYYWDFPCYVDGRPYVSRGIVAASHVGNKSFLRDILARRGVSMEGALHKAWPIRHFDPRDCYSQPRMLLVGDAMGSDPLFSEGISQALASGQLAAEAIRSAFVRNDLSFSGYTKGVRSSRVGKELINYWRAARFLYSRHAELLLSLLYESEELRNLIGHSYAGTSNLHDSKGRIVGLLAGHLLKARRNLRNFREAAAIAEGAACAGAAVGALAGAADTGFGG